MYYLIVYLLIRGGARVGSGGTVPHLINISVHSLIACAPPVTHLCPTSGGWLAPPLLLLYIFLSNPDET